MTLRQLRVNNKITIADAAKISGLPCRTYIRYENDEEKQNTIKYKYAYDKLSSYLEITEDKGILTLEKIKDLLIPIFKKNNIDLCILFGSYAKGKATEKSDVDLLIDSTTTGIAFYNVVEEMRDALHKRVDLIRLGDLEKGSTLIREILKDGVKIYG